MGGVEPAFTFCKKCLERGKSVVSSNKALVAAKAQELFAAARENNAAFMFEASVCGGIPVIRTMFSSLSANNIVSFAGILNGTTNFILTKMINEKMSFDTALKLAQEKGYAEKLIRAVQAQFSEKIYSHVSKKNAASLAVHEKCGFRQVLDYAKYIDGSVSRTAVTLCCR